MAGSVLYLLVVVLSVIDAISARGCVQLELERCICSNATVDGTSRYMVNCTDTGFNDTTPLEHLPFETEVLIFTGNNIQELPWNVFGTLNNYTKLEIVDMSNNKIKEIFGKSYHRVPNVRRLILNHNRISIADEKHHPRIFSNFINLEELHLTNAFVDSEDNLGIDLHDIFVNSNLTKLLKLHLEQNEVVGFKDRDVFCGLPSLMDLHLGDNRLESMDFRIDCLHHLRYLDLEGNKIKRLTEFELASLEFLPSRNQSLKIDLIDNPFSCECGFLDLIEWLRTTKVTVERSEKLRCIHADGEIYPKNPSHLECRNEQVHVKEATYGGMPTAAMYLTFFMAIASLIILLGVLYHNRKRIQTRINPFVESVSRKVYYSSIGHNDEQEIIDV